MGATVVDLFAGCGGLGLGLEQAGFETVFVNELHQDALATYLLNRVDSPVKERQNHSNDIREITQRTGELEALGDRLRRTYGDITLVAGGPPCQGFSGIGHRRTFALAKAQIPSNHLYREMATFVEAVRPKVFLFENVGGLLTSRWTPSGDNGEVWEDVQSAFSAIRVKLGRNEVGYRLGSMLLRAKDYGVPQNRPRVLLVGLRSDITPVHIEGSIASGLLPGPTASAPDPIDVLSDLVDPDWAPGGATVRYPGSPRTPFQRFMRTSERGELMPKGSPLSEHEYSRHSPRIVAKFQYMLDHDGDIPAVMRTRKFAQRVIPERWGPSGPHITAASLPDDYVHFCQPRVLTVREWARLQTFPDWYQFAGNRTTGGRRRAGDPSIGNWNRELPKYTQIGNAVPVGLGRAVGEHLLKLLGEA